jgi:hypothetical protein
MKSKLYPCLSFAALVASALLSTCGDLPVHDGAAPLRFDGDSAPLLYGRPEPRSAPPVDGLHLWLEAA